MIIAQALEPYQYVKPTDRIFMPIMSFGLFLTYFLCLYLHVPF